MAEPTHKKMGTIIERSRKDGSKAFVAQIVIKKGGAIAHREAQTFDRKPAANAWIVKREAELKRPGGLDHKEDPKLAAVTDRYIADSKKTVSGTKAQVLRTIKNSDLAEIKCSEITSQNLVSFARELNKDVQPQTCGNYFSHLSNIFTIAKPGWGYPLERPVFEDAVTVARTLGLIGKGKERTRRPTLEELDRLMEHFGRPMCPGVIIIVSIGLKDPAQMHLAQYDLELRRASPFFLDQLHAACLAWSSSPALPQEPPGQPIPS
jgi:hypothetical protein